MPIFDAAGLVVGGVAAAGVGGEVDVESKRRCDATWFLVAPIVILVLLGVILVGVTWKAKKK